MTTKSAGSVHQVRQRKLAFLKMTMRNILSRNEFAMVNLLRATFSEYHYIDIALAKLEVDLLTLEKQRNMIIERLSYITTECHYICEDEKAIRKIKKDLSKYVKNPKKI